MKVIATTAKGHSPHEGFVALLMALSSFRLAFGLEYTPPGEVLPWSIRLYLGPFDVVLRGNHHPGMLSDEYLDDPEDEEWDH